MGVLKTVGVAVALTSLSATAALPEQSLLHRVTDCVGRLSAQMEHHWLLSDTPTTRIERDRAQLVDVLDALTTPETATRILAARIDAKMAHASLLTQAAFGTDPRTKAWARRRADMAIGYCDDILLPAPPPAPLEQDHAKTAVSVTRKTSIASQ